MAFPSLQFALNYSFPRTPVFPSLSLISFKNDNSQASTAAEQTRRGDGDRSVAVGCNKRQQLSQESCRGVRWMFLVCMETVGSGLGWNCSRAGADKWALIIAPTSKSGGFYYLTFNSNLGRISGRLHCQDFFSHWQNGKKKVKKEWWQGVGEGKSFPPNSNQKAGKWKQKKKK